MYRDVKVRLNSDDNSLNAFLSYDEKSGIQAIGNLYPDKYSDPDHGKARHGALSLLGGIDLYMGHTIPIAERGTQVLNS